MIWSTIHPLDAEQLRMAQLSFVGAYLSPGNLEKLD